MKKFFVFLIIIAVAYVAYLVFRQPALAPTVAEEEAPLATSVASAPIATSVGSAKDTIERVATSMSSKETDVLQNENIRVTSPKPDAVLTSPFIVAGEARVFENMLNVRVKNANGDVLIS